MPGSPLHLARRFFDVVTSHRLSRAEREAVERHLGDPDLIRLFFQQPVADQRHGLEAALVVLAHGRPDLVKASMLHDIGKRHASLGPLGRAVASVAIRLGIRLTPRFALYRDHGEVAAGELSRVGGIVADFARHHHGPRPGSITAQDWDVLQAADAPRSLYRRPISTSIDALNHGPDRQ